MIESIVYKQCCGEMHALSTITYQSVSTSPWGAMARRSLASSTLGKMLQEG